jgi:hypothetical protein
MRRLAICLLLSTASCHAETRSLAEISLASANAGMTVLDMAGTAHCLAAGKCYEANPLVPSNAVARGAMEAGLFGLATWYAHRERVRGHKAWWVAPVVQIGLHAVGFISSERMR